MNIHEYQAKQLFERFGIATPKGGPAETPQQAEEVAAGIRDRAPSTNVVMTGRGAAPELLEVADTATEMRKLKHAYDRGIKAKKGIEY